MVSENSLKLIFPLPLSSHSSKRSGLPRVRVRVKGKARVRARVTVRVRACP